MIDAYFILAHSRSKKQLGTDVSNLPLNKAFDVVSPDCHGNAASFHLL